MILAVILAKESSGRLSGKNSREINGIPLYLHAVRYAKCSKLVNRVVVSTDSEKIAARSIIDGAETVIRPIELCGDASNAQVIDHAISSLGLKPESISWVVCLQPDHPGRTVPLDDAIRYAIQRNVDILISTHPDGILSGSFRIYGQRALLGALHLVVHSMMDGARNIHTKLDLDMAAQDMNNARREIMIGSRPVSTGGPVFVIAEVACNHMCSVRTAKEMIESATWAGADAVKFQTYKAEKLVRKDAPIYWGGTDKSQLEYYRNLDRLTKEDYAEIFAYAGEEGVIAFSTPFDLESADMLESLGVSAFKIASSDILDTRLIRHVAGFGKPLLMSTGGATAEEIDQAVGTVLDTGNHNLIVMACTLIYPSPQCHANLLRIRALMARYPSIMVGYSDHTEPEEHMIVPAMAAALGAVTIEKHFTLNREWPGSGNYFATPPTEFKRMVENIRLAESTMGSGYIGPIDREKETIGKARRSIVAGRDMEPGIVIQSSMLEMKRPADGIPGYMMNLVIGKRAKRRIGADEPLRFEDLE